MIPREYERKIASTSEFYPATIELARILKHTDDLVDIPLGMFLLPWTAIGESICSLYKIIAKLGKRYKGGPKVIKETSE